MTREDVRGRLMTPDEAQCRLAMTDNACLPLSIVLSGIGGLQYSTQDDSFTFADSLPREWSFMEFQVPVQRRPSEAVTWVRAYSARSISGSGHAVKTVSVESNPFATTLIQPWADDESVVDTSPPANARPGEPPGHVGWRFSAIGNATVHMTLG